MRLHLRRQGLDGPRERFGRNPRHIRAGQSIGGVGDQAPQQRVRPVGQSGHGLGLERFIIKEIVVLGDRSVRVVA